MKTVIVFLLFLKISHSLKILAVFHFDGKSHLRAFEPIVRELIQRGHQLEVITHHSLNINSERYSEILIEHEKNKKGMLEFDIENFNINKKLLQFGGPFVLSYMGSISCHQLYSSPGVKKLMSSSDEKFDLIMVELFNNDCGLVFSDKFKVPTIGMSSSLLMPWYKERFGQPDSLAYAPSGVLWHGPNLDFLDRVENVIGTMLFKIAHLYNIYYNQYLAEEYFKRKMTFSFSVLAKNMSLVLVNDHRSIKYAQPTVPAVVEVAGVHILQPKKLPQNIEKFINESTHGVIYFSLGSMIKGHTFPQEKREEFLKAFARLPQRVLWKWENETMPGKPDNVMIQKWMPQFDILSHPNVKAFISHGGLLGVTEAVHCGVPMMVMPQYGDQHTNAKAVEANGGGVILYLRDATEEKVYQNLKTILDPEFREKAKALSERFRDRPMSPMDTAIYWVEYVARHKGAPHLRTAAVDMPLYQYLLLDVFAFLAAVLLVSLYVTYKISSLIFRSIFSKKKVKQS